MRRSVAAARTERGGGAREVSYQVPRPGGAKAGVGWRGGRPLSLALSPLRGARGLTNNVIRGPAWGEGTWKQLALRGSVGRRGWQKAYELSRCSLRL
jgi:hypothetical protein